MKSHENHPLAKIIRSKTQINSQCYINIRELTNEVITVLNQCSVPDHKRMREFNEQFVRKISDVNNQHKLNEIRKKYFITAITCVLSSISIGASLSNILRMDYLKI